MHTHLKTLMSSMLKSFCQVALLILNTEQQLNGGQEGTKEVVTLALTVILDYWNELINTQDAVSRDGGHTGEVLFDIPQNQVPPFFSQIALCVVCADNEYKIRCNFGVT